MSDWNGTDTDSEDSKRKRGKESPEKLFVRSKITKRTPVKRKQEIKEPEMEEVKEMFTEMMREIKQIKKNQTEQTVKMEKILKENEDMKNHIKKLDKKIETLDKTVETLEREGKRNNLIIVGYEPQTNNNQDLKFELEDFNRKALKVDVKIRNAKRIGNKVCAIEMEDWEGKVKILKAKSNLRYRTDTRIYINNDLTNKEREIQGYIKEIERAERNKGNTTRMGYKKLTINGIKWEWNEDRRELVETKPPLPKKLEKQSTGMEDKDDELAKKKDKDNKQVKIERKIVTEETKEILNKKEEMTTIGTGEDRTWRLATVNVRGMSGKEMELNEIMVEANLNILAVTETKKKMQGYMELEGGHLMIYSGVGSNQWAREGVGCVISKQDREGIREWKGISGRLMRLEIEKDKEVFTILVVYGPNEGAQLTEIDEFWNALQVEVDESKGTLIVMGDMNGRVGNNAEGMYGCIGKFGESVKNKNGQRIIDFCEMNNMVVGNTFYQHKNIHKYTREVPSRNEKSIIDLVLVERNTLKKIKDIRVKRGYDIGSDHFLVSVNIKRNKTERERIGNDEKKIEYTNIRTYKLGRIEMQKKYQQKIEIEIKKREITKTERNLEEQWETFKAILIKAATEVCGVSRATNRRKQTHWWSNEIKQEIKKKKQLWKRYLSNNKRPEDYETYKKQREKVKIMVKEAKAKTWEEFGERMEENASGNAKMLYHILRGIRKEKKNPLKNIKDIEGKIITDENKIAERWKEYFQQLLKAGHIEVEDKTEATETMQEEKAEKEEDEVSQEYGTDIKRSEVIEAVKRIKIGKAAGVDGLRPEMIKYIGNEGITWLHRILQQAWNTQTMPREWDIGIITPIHKKGSFNECKNYRGISLLCTTYKVYERIIQERLRQAIETTLSDSQAAFRHSRSTQDWIFILRQIAEKVTATNGEIYVAAIDLAKAFDSIKRDEIWKILELRGVSKKLVNVIKSIYRKTENVVRISGKTTESFVTDRGVRQGGVLSPLLFITVMDEISKKVNKDSRRTHIGYNKLRPVYISELMYADDLLLFANKKAELQNKIEEWSKHTRKYGLQINTRKTEIMKIASKAEEVQVQIQGEEVKNVNELKYLGTITRPDGRIDQEVTSRVSRVISLYKALYKVFFNRKEITKRTKVKIFESVLVPMLTYGGESWVLTKKLKQKITSCEMKILRQIAGVTKLDKIRNEKIRSDLKVTSVVQKIEQQQLRWFGHIVRMQDERTVKIIWETEIDSKRRRGRPRRRWNAEVAENLRKRGVGWTQAKHMARDRNEWRRFITSTPKVEEAADK